LEHRGRRFQAEENGYTKQQDYETPAQASHRPQGQNGPEDERRFRHGRHLQLGVDLSSRLAVTRAIVEESGQS